MKIKLQIDKEIADAICTRFGYDQKSEDEKKEFTREDFLVEKIANYLTGEATQHLSEQAKIDAENTVKESLKGKGVKNDETEKIK